MCNSQVKSCINYKCVMCKSITMDLLSNLTAFSGVALSLMEGGGVNITTLHKSSVDRYEICFNVF